VNSYVRRRLVNAVSFIFCALAAGTALAPCAAVLWMVVSKGISGLSVEFFTSLPKPVGEVGGGMGNAVAGTLEIVALACVLGLPLGIGAGLFLAERGDTAPGRAVRFTTEVLSGVPSIVVGIVAYELVVVPMKRFSALAGAVALAMLMLPTVARTTEEMLRLVPRALREGALALGVPAWRTSLFVVLRTAAGGVATAAILSIARAAGETAPLLFTALNNQYWNLKPDQPTASLTVQIFNYALSPYEEWHARAWSAALVLLVFVAALNLTARALARGRLRDAG